MATNKVIKELGEELTETGVAQFNRAGNTFLYANNAFLEIFACDEKQLREDPSVLFRLFSNEDLDYLKQQYESFVRTGHFRTSEIRLSFPGGDNKHLSCDAVLLDEGKILLLLIKDITRRALREEYVIRISAQKDTMLDMLTHNLSGPLFVSKDILALTRKGLDENKAKDLDKMISLVQENTEQCIDIVNDFLQKEHFESMRVSVSRVRFDIIEKINITLEKLREMNKRKTFTLTSASSTLHVYSDDVKFFQVIHNVLSNAIKYTPEDGLIAVVVQNLGSAFRICVKDNGIGIPDDHRADIFMHRLRGRPGLRGEKSSGLGLSIAKKLVTMMDGEIWFESKEKEGTSFYIQLPSEYTVEASH